VGGGPIRVAEGPPQKKRGKIAKWESSLKGMMTTPLPSLLDALFYDLETEY